MKSVYRYRLEWPSARDGAVADGWSLHVDASAARRSATRLLARRRRPAPWVRVVLLDGGCDAEDAFVTAADAGEWSAERPMPPARAKLSAPPEIERLRRRALRALDVVLEWTLRRGLLGRSAAEEVRLVLDAAMLGVVSSRDR